MAEGYIWDEHLSFIIKYLQWCTWDVKEEKGDVGEILEGARQKFMMNPTLCDLTHQYVLTNITLMSIIIWKLWITRLICEISYVFYVFQKISFTCWILDVALYDYGLKKWKLEQANNPNLPPFIEWVQNVVHDHPMDSNNLEDLDKVLLCSRPSQTMTRYTQMKVYGGWKQTKVSQNQ
jgi:hypothetical protein